MIATVKRRPYLERLLAFRDTEPIKVITGVRRCGKSTLLAQLASALVDSGVARENILSLNFESLATGIHDYRELYDKLMQHVRKVQKTAYILLDEVQELAGWEKAVNSLRIDADCDIYITGSNAHLLSSELATHLSGRYVELHVLPFSLPEFIELHRLDRDDPQRALALYLRYGGMPGLAGFDFDDTRMMQMLDGIYSTVLVRDVLARVHSTDRTLVERVAAFLADSIGSQVSVNSMGNYIASSKERETPAKAPAHRSVAECMNALQDSFLFYKAARFDIKGKRLLKTLEKNYVVDLGLRSLLLGKGPDADRGHVIENAVYLELARRSSKINVGKLASSEIDFLVRIGTDLRYVQVTESLAEPAVRERELTPLRAVQDEFPKVVITGERTAEGLTEDGIIVIPLLEYLLGQSRYARELGV